MSERKVIHYHVGAHKTATTYMQSRMRSNRQRLAHAGIDYVDLWSKQPEVRSYRKALKRTIESDAPDPRILSRLAADLRKIVTEASPSPGSLVVLSYENVMGTYDTTQGPAPYPHAAAAAQHIVEAFPDHDVRLFFSIRSLDRFLESGYVQRVFTRRETRRFRRYIRAVDLESLSWVRAVRELESVIGTENLTVWEYESFFSGEEAIWRDLLGHDDPNSLLVKPAKNSNYSLSAKGLKYMRSINRVATPADGRKFRRFVKETFGRGKRQQSPKLMREKRRNQLQARYAQDCEELSDLLGNNAPLGKIAEG